jgi:hypothetical protein
MGADGSNFGAVESAAPVGTTVECAACHNDVTLTHDSVVFPSGLELTDLGDQARCMECHQGRASKVTVDDNIAAAVGDDLDTVSEDLGFVNIHYYAAGATRYGTEVKGGYEYDGLAYDPRFDHVEGYQSCINCHDMHTLEIKVEECAVCHPGVASLEDVEMIRFTGSLKDYDGDGDVEEPINDELAGLQSLLLQNMQAYSAEVVGTPIAYDPVPYPYFFIDTNADGEAGEDEANFGNQYNAWTGRLLQAAYNYQVSQKDPGAFAHGGKYIIQLLYDSIADLNDHVANPFDLSLLNREDPGHFAASGEPWRHWDVDGEVSASCSKCHSAEGLPAFITTGGDTYPQPVASGLNCASCHDDLATFTRYVSEEVEFPSGAVLALDNTESNLCLNCHQGRESTPTVNAVIANSGADDDEVSDDLSFRNPHYFAAGATLFGTEAQGGYEYDGRRYNSRNMHVPGFQACIECHDTHELRPKAEACTTCHGTQSEEELHDIRMTNVDFDGDGNTSSGIAEEIENMQAALLDAIMVYTAEEVGTPIVFDPGPYPYWFIDTNGDGVADPGEANYDNRYNVWTPRLVQAVYNHTWAAKDPGAFAHNGLYMLQLLYDSMQDIGGDVSGMTRPEAAQ